MSVFAVGALALASLVLFMPAYTLAVSKYNTSEKHLVALEKKYGEAGQEKELIAQIRDINNKILLLLSGDATARLTLSQTITSILNIRGNAIKIFAFTYETIANQERIVLTGTANDRDGLANFVETLKRNPTFTNVTIPISSYVKSENIDFSIVIERNSKTPAKK